MRRSSGLLAAALLASSSLISGCKSQSEKICLHLEALLEEPAPGAAPAETKKVATPEEKAKCVTEITAELDRCDNPDTVAACLVGSKTLDELAICDRKCQKKIAGPKPKGSATPDPSGAE